MSHSLFHSLHQEALTHLQNLLRINTTNPSGHEIEAVKYLSSVLKKDNIPHHIFEPSPGRASLVARLKGNGSKSALLLSSHLDVVPADKKYWDHDPFCGDVIDGYIWGRGAVDMKQMTVMELMCLLAAKRGQIPLARDLVFVAVADEEAGCEWGSKWLVANKPDLLSAEYALNEVGGFSLYVDGVEDKVFYPIGVAEKGVCWFSLTVDGEPGHGSLPHDCQALVHMAEIAARLGNQLLPYHAHPLAHRFVDILAHHQKMPRRFLIKLLTIPGLHRFILNLIPRDKRPAFKALFHNTVSPTIFQAGSKINVIPGRAQLQVDGRILPGQTIESFLSEIRNLVGNKVKIEIFHQQEPSETETANEFFSLLEKTLVKHEPTAVPVPYLIPGFTDSAHYSKLGIKCYGFAPLKLSREIDFSKLFHGHNERLPVDGFFWGLDVLWDVIEMWCRA